MKRITSSYFSNVVLFKMFSLVVTLITAPLLLLNIGAVSYGLFILLISVFSIMIFFDFGIGQGVVNPLVGSWAEGDYAAVSKSISNTLASSCIGSFFVVGIVEIVAIIYSPKDIFKVSTSLADEFNLSFHLTVICSFFYMILNFGNFINLITGKSRRYLFWTTTPVVCSAISSLVFSFFTDSLVVLVLAHFIPAIICQIINLFHVFSSNYLIKPSFKLIHGRAILTNFQERKMFFASQLNSLTFVNMDTLLIGLVLGPVELAMYSLTVKLVILPFGVFQTYLLPNWPEIKRLYNLKDDRGVSFRFRRMFAQAGYSSFVVSVMILLFGQDIVRIWTNDLILPSNHLILALSVWMICLGAGIPISILLNATENSRFVIVSSLSSIPVNIIVSFFGLLIFKNSAWVILGSISSWLFCSAIPAKKYMKEVIGFKHREDGENI